MGLSPIIGTAILLLVGFLTGRVSTLSPALSRRDILPLLITATATSTSTTAAEPAVFRTTAVGRSEFTNSITASRDTNISPTEAYNVIREQIPSCLTRSDRCRALDVGAGAGLSTSVLHNEKGYTTIDAVDWSRTAWDDNVMEQPELVRFYAMDDAQFFRQQQPSRYDVIVYNFAVNSSKAQTVARQYLRPQQGVLLAPCNDRADYWYKQTYLLLDSEGTVVWKSDAEVGAWSVQFQPDVTSKTCTGIWCGGFNGYQQQ